MGDVLLTWGAGVVLWLQSFSSGPLDAFFKAVTFLGEEQFYLVLLPLIFWCLDKGAGARLAFLFLFSAYANSGLKDIFRTPRPFQFDSRVRRIGESTGYGFPSGHAQGTGVVWGYLATRWRKGWAWALGIVLPLLVALSRVYLGVHFPHDVLGGLLAAVALVAIYNWFLPAAEAWVGGLRLGARLALAAAVPLVLLLIHPTEGAATPLGSLLGMGVGFTLEGEFVRFSVDGPWWRRALRFLLGLAVTFALYLGLKGIFPPGLLFRLLRYGLIGLWAGFLAPWLFVKTALAEGGA